VNSVPGSSARGLRLSVGTYKLNASIAVSDMAQAKGGGRVAWFKDADGNIFAVESNE
jgi:hypothetical protein